MKSPEAKSDLEKFIGENLINKIGIVITIIGVAIGVKYSIDNDLISPLSRVILGYFAGIALLGFGIKLRQKYANYSAVLVSGAMAVMYFITYFAHDFYHLIPQVPTFIIMAVFTLFTVFAALNYNQQVIALIGLTGAYAIPFLLSDGSGKALILFLYMTMLNTGILFLAFKKQWRTLFYTAFILTWIIYLSWFAMQYNRENHFGLGLSFALVFYLIFYLTFVAYRAVSQKKFDAGDVLLLLTNSFLFYGMGYALLSDHPTGQHLLGLFTLLNACTHFTAGVFINRKQLADKNMFHLIAGLVLTFITIAIPVQLDGNWVSILWAAEAALLFWIGRSKGAAIYEKLSFPLMIIALLSLIQDWSMLYKSYAAPDEETIITPILNTNFLASVLCIAAFAFINKIHHHNRYPSTREPNTLITKLTNIFIPAALIFLVYYAFRLEIDNYWTQLYLDSEIQIDNNDEIYPGYYLNENFYYFKKIWIINYTLLFASLLAWVNFKKIRSVRLGQFNLILILLSLAAFLTQGLFILSELREAYLEQPLAEYFHTGAFNLAIRYVSLAFAAFAIYSGYKNLHQDFMNIQQKKPFDLALHASLVWILSSEAIHWMDLLNFSQSYKLGLSILWGTYSLYLIGLGIWRKKKHLRLMGIILFGITLIKLFMYDIEQMNTLSKTIVFVSLGVLLLIISFLYNKYKLIISDEKHH